MKSGVNMYEGKMRISENIKNYISTHGRTSWRVLYNLYAAFCCSWMSVVGQIFSRRRHGREPKKKRREKNFRYKKNSKAEKKEQEELFRVDFRAAGFCLSVSAVWTRRIYYYSGREKHLAKILLASPRIWNQQKWERIRFRVGKKLLFPRWIV